MHVGSSQRCGAGTMPTGRVDFASSKDMEYSPANTVLCIIYVVALTHLCTALYVSQCGSSWNPTNPSFAWLNLQVFTQTHEEHVPTPDIYGPCFSTGRLMAISDSFGDYIVRCPILAALRLHAQWNFSILTCPRPWRASQTKGKTGADTLCVESPIPRAPDH